MKKRDFLKAMNLVRILTVGITLFVIVTLTSSNLVSITLNNISKKQVTNLEAIEKEPSSKFELSAGLAPNTDVNNQCMPMISQHFNYKMMDKMWGYIVNSSVYDEGTCYFDIEDPSDITYLNDTQSDEFLSGGTGVCGKLIACENSTGALWKIDPDTGDMTYIGGGGVGLNGLAMDYTSRIVYGASGSVLYLIDPDNGDQEYIGDFGSGVNEMIGIASDADGNMYGWDLGDKLWTINIETGEATEVGPLGINLNYAQDGCFDYSEEVLFLTAYIGSPYNGSYLCTCDLETGMCTVGDQIGGNSQITASVIYLDYCWHQHDIGIEDIINPSDGYASEDIEIIVKVENHGHCSENDVLVNVVILKEGVTEEYNETIYVDVGWKETIDVEMPKWTPDDWQNSSNEYINYKIIASIKLDGDENPDNDYKEKWIELYYGYFHDVECTGINSPESGFAQTFPVTGHIKNLGQYEECCFKTYVEIAELDTENQVELLSEDFTDSTFPPNGWTVTNSKWQLFNSSYAGGMPPESRFQYYPAEDGMFRMYTSLIDTSDYDTVEIEFRQFVNHYTSPYILQVETSNDGINWDVVWNFSPSGNIGPETVNILTAKNVGSTTYVSWTFNGYSWNIDYWYIDDIVIYGYNSFVPEYEDYQCTTTIEPGEELEFEFDEWTPEFLAEETTGTKKYLVKAWTDMDDPPDENPDNDLFSKSIILDFFHDVGVKEIISLYEKASGTYKNWWYIAGSSLFARWCPWTGEMEYILGSIIGPGGGTFVEDEWWICDSFGQIYIVDTETGDTSYIGSSGTSQLVGLAYHEKSKTLYGYSNQVLYKINMDNGKATFVGPFQQLGYYMASIDCDKDGVMYGYDLNYANSRLYTIDLETGKASPIGLCFQSFMYGQDMDYDYDNGIMYACVFNYNTSQGELHGVDLETGKFTFICTLPGGQLITSFAIPYTILLPERYVPLGYHDIEVIVENIGTFPELELMCYAEIYEYFTNCTNGTLVYEDNSSNIDLDEPLGGNKTLNFDSYNFATEGLYGLFLNIPDDDDDYPNNNEVILGIGADDTPPVSIHSLYPETPDGDNGWYVSDVEITICAEDPSISCGHPGSGVKEIKYTINGAGGTLPGSVGTFEVTEDGNDIVVEYWAIDWVGNVESKNSFTIDMDQTNPIIEPDGVQWDSFRENPLSNIWYVRFWTDATDATSGTDRVEMYINEGLHEINASPDETRYEFVIMWSTVLETVTFSWRHYDRAGWYTYDEIQGDEPSSKSYSSDTKHFNKNQVISYDI